MGCTPSAQGTMFCKLLVSRWLWPLSHPCHDPPITIRTCICCTIIHQECKHTNILRKLAELLKATKYLGWNKLVNRYKPLDIYISPFPTSDLKGSLVSDSTSLNCKLTWNQSLFAIVGYPSRNMLSISFQVSSSGSLNQHSIRVHLSVLQQIMMLINIAGIFTACAACQQSYALSHYPPREYMYVRLTERLTLVPAPFDQSSCSCAGRTESMDVIPP